MIDTLDRRPAAPPTRRPSLPSGWYDPDSSAFELLDGKDAVNDAVARSLVADRTIDAPLVELDDD
jgi:hypothetical protein